MDKVVRSFTNNQAGTILPLITGVLLFSGMCLYAAMQISTLYSAMNARVASQSEAHNAKSYLQLLYSVPDTCSLYMLQGTFLSELQKKIKDPTYATDPGLTVYYPTNPANSTVLFGPQATFGKLKVNQITFNVHTSNQTPQSFVIDFILSMTDGTGSYTFLSPFYVATDTSGKPTKCFFTDYITSPATLQDQLCATMVSSKTIYDANKMKCVTGKHNG